MSTGWKAGEYRTGSQRAASGGVRLRLSGHVAASASVTRNVTDLPQGTFAANVWNETRLPGDARRALLLKYTHLIAF